MYPMIIDTSEFLLVVVHSKNNFNHNEWAENKKELKMIFRNSIHYIYENNEDRIYKSNVNNLNLVRSKILYSKLINGDECEKY